MIFYNLAVFHDVDKDDYLVVNLSKTKAADIESIDTFTVINERYKKEKGKSISELYIYKPFFLALGPYKSAEEAFKKIFIIGNFLTSKCSPNTVTLTYVTEVIEWDFNKILVVSEYSLKNIIQEKKYESLDLIPIRKDSSRASRLNTREIVLLDFGVTGKEEKSIEELLNYNDEITFSYTYGLINGMTLVAEKLDIMGINYGDLIPKNKLEEFLMITMEAAIPKLFETKYIETFSNFEK